jgi:HicB family
VPRLGVVASSARPSETTGRERSHSGRLLLRMPEKLHAELASEADRAGMSLNQFITTTLADSIGQEPTPTRQRQSSPEESQPDEGRAKWFTALLIVNLVIVAAAGVLAILLLASAWGG